MNEPSRQPVRAPEPDDSPVFRGDGQAAHAWCFVRLILQGIRSSPLQLSLTMLTMSVGAMALALTFFIGRGAIERVWQDVEEMMGQWVVAHSDPGLDQHWMGGRARPDFTEAEYQEIKNRLPDAKFVCPIYMNMQPVICRERELILPVDGITEEVSHEPLFRAVRGPGF